MKVLSVKQLELSQPLEPLADYLDYEGIRFFCFLYGEILGFFTIWHYGRMVSLGEVREYLRDTLSSRSDLSSLPIWSDD